MTKKVTDDDHFISLSSSAQALYLHLMMSADDDGFCSQINASMFKAHASTADLEQLLALKYLIRFESGVMVIKHWRMANAIRKDRYTKTSHTEEMAMLSVKENGSYTLSEEYRKGLIGADGCQVVAERLPVGCQVGDTGKDRLGKDRVVKKNNTDERKRSADVKQVISVLNSLAGTNYKAESKTNQKHILARLAEGFTVEDLCTVIKKKYAEWNGTDMEKYLRPETLFGSKFESYLNAPVNRRNSDHIKVKVPEYFEAQKNGTLPEEKKASAEQISELKKLMEEMK